MIATASRESKRQICIQRGGADHAIDYTAKDWQKQVMQITGGKGVDVVYDPVVSASTSIFIICPRRGSGRDEYAG